MPTLSEASRIRATMFLRLSVGIASMAKGNDHYEQHVLLDRVDDPVVADTNPVAGTTAQRPGGWWPGIFSQKGDGTLDPGADAKVELAHRPEGGGANFDAVAAHAQPRSARTCSQGTLSPTSAIAASNAATSSVSSMASRSCS